MDSGKQILHKERREQRAVDVNVKLCSSTLTGFTFNVYNDDEKIKYIGDISQDHIHDSCTCQSFMHGNSENYQKENPLPFTCKHILKAHSLMEGYW